MKIIPLFLLAFTLLFTLLFSCAAGAQENPDVHRKMVSQWVFLLTGRVVYFWLEGNTAALSSTASQLASEVADCITEECDADPDLFANLTDGVLDAPSHKEMLRRLPFEVFHRRASDLGIDIVQHLYDHLPNTLSLVGQTTH